MQQLITPKYCDPNSILLINPTSILRKLYCLFRVKCTATTRILKQGMCLWVEEVACTTKDELIYWIMGKPYHYSEITY